MKLTPLQKKIFDLASDGPLLIEGPSFMRSLNTCRTLWHKIGLHYCGSGGRILVWSDKDNTQLDPLIKEYGTNTYSLITIKHKLTR